MRSDAAPHAWRRGLLPLGYSSASGAHAAYRAVLTQGSSAMRIEVGLIYVARLETLLRTVMPKALSGHLPAIRSVMSIVEQRQGLARALRASMRAMGGVEARP